MVSRCYRKKNPVVSLLVSVADASDHGMTAGTLSSCTFAVRGIHYYNWKLFCQKKHFAVSLTDALQHASYIWQSPTSKFSVEIFIFLSCVYVLHISIYTFLHVNL